ncbi:unnamed protein product [Symbiodinium microadriaticum]|nr:unnamed protein product [Symbiodinium sp. KB8]CAE7242963.1 unnamed protein product [Symbiodinium microadriaticum]
MVVWPKWEVYEECLAKDRIMSANGDFQDFKKQVLKASVQEIDEQAAHATVMWNFLIAFAAKKHFYRNLIIQVFNKLMQVPSWVAAWEVDVKLHEKVQTLHEDLQSAIGAQHEVLRKSIAPAASKSVTLVRMDERPEEVRLAIEREKIIDAIKEEVESEEWAAEEEIEAEVSAETSTHPSLSALQDGIDAAIAIDDPSKMDSCGLSALNKLRIGCISCAGDDHLFSQELDNAPKVFNFLLSLLKQHKEFLNGVAEVINLLMASTWCSVFEKSQLLQERLRELPKPLQAALGLQSSKVLAHIDADARRMVTGGEVSDDMKIVADRMQSIRAPRTSGGYSQAAKSGSKSLGIEKWKAAKTPEGHSYYYNSRTGESTWERPMELGGPLVYKSGDEVEVWSNGMRAWGKGKVLQVKDDKVTAEFCLRDGSVARKELPCQHKDLRPAAAEAMQAWSSDEQEAYQSWFSAMKDGSSSSKPALQVSQFLWRSGLPREALKQVWAIANPGSRTSLSFEEFAKCCRLVAHCQALDADFVKRGDRPLRVRLRTECLHKRPPALPRFEKGA